MYYAYYILIWFIFLQCTHHFAQISEVNLSVIGPYVDYLIQKQGVNSIFGKIVLGFFKIFDCLLL